MIFRILGRKLTRKIYILRSASKSSKNTPRIPSFTHLRVNKESRLNSNMTNHIAIIGGGAMGKVLLGALRTVAPECTIAVSDRQEDNATATDGADIVFLEIGRAHV